jgi:hypothetical protein
VGHGPGQDLLPLDADSLDQFGARKKRCLEYFQEDNAEMLKNTLRQSATLARTPIGINKREVLAHDTTVPEIQPIGDVPKTAADYIQSGYRQMANHRPQFFERHRIYTRKVYLRKIQKRGEPR